MKNESFKWKPPEYNTVDFLVRFKRNEYNELMIMTHFESGKVTNDISNIKRYQVMNLLVGYNQKNHGYLNPYQIFHY